MGLELKTVTLYITLEQYTELRRLAIRRAVSHASIVREALTDYLGRLQTVKLDKE